MLARNTLSHIEPLLHGSAMLLMIRNSFQTAVSLAIGMWQILFTQLKMKGLIHDIVWVEMVGGAIGGGRRASPLMMAAAEISQWAPDNETGA
jgi:hypothetical protein